MKDKTMMKALKLAFEAGFLAGKQDGWINNPAIERAWKTYLAQMKEGAIE